jgi:flagellar biosynthetic protein FliP
MTPGAGAARASAWPLAIFCAAAGIAVLLAGAPASAAPASPIPGVDVRVTSPQSPREVSQSIQILVLLTVLSLAPALLILTTSFTRIVIVLSLVRSAVGVPTIPPNQVIVGLSLFLTLFTMAPVLANVNESALQPYLRGDVPQQAAMDRASGPVRDFMIRQTRERDLALFVSLAKEARPQRPQDIPMYVVIPAFVISELRTAFMLGALIFIPFLVIDMVVSSTLMSMGMMMLPPAMISLPFKLLLFVLVDGWHLVARALVASLS